MPAETDPRSRACPQCGASLNRNIHEVTCFVAFQNELAQRHAAFLAEADVPDLERIEQCFTDWRPRITAVLADPFTLTVCINARRDDVDALIGGLTRIRTAATRSRHTHAPAPIAAVTTAP